MDTTIRCRWCHKGDNPPGENLGKCYVYGDHYYHGTCYILAERERELPENPPVDDIEDDGDQELLIKLVEVLNGIRKDLGAISKSLEERNKIERRRPR